MTNFSCYCCFGSVDNLSTIILCSGVSANVEVRSVFGNSQRWQVASQPHGHSQAICCKGVCTTPTVTAHNHEDIFLKCLYKADPQKFRSAKISHHVIIIFRQKYIYMYGAWELIIIFRKVYTYVWKPGNKASDVVVFFHSAPHDG